jgi:hypothetical protein
LPLGGLWKDDRRSFVSNPLQQVERLDQVCLEIVAIFLRRIAQQVTGFQSNWLM